jgi:hypothetical protein
LHVLRSGTIADLNQSQTSYFLPLSFARRDQVIPDREDATRETPST